MRPCRTTQRARCYLSTFAGIVLAATAALAADADERSKKSEQSERSQLAALLGSDVDAGFSFATEPRTFEFPRDHGPHPGYRNEWWYVTGNVDSTAGRRFGFELTIFRFALTPEPPVPDSSWRTNQVFIAHFAVTDAGAEKFHVAERFSRGALGLAGATAVPFRVWIDDWKISAIGDAARPERWRLSASDEDFALDLDLVAEKPPVLNGSDGLSQKSGDPRNASYYYSITRWRSAGRMRIGGDEFAVTGLAWLDREWSSSALAADQAGWDWFALQLSDGSELMFYSLRKVDGAQDAFSAGTWVFADGTSRHIDRQEIDIAVTQHWASPAGGSYPAAWEIGLPALDLQLTVEPVLADQELFTTVRYWEGAVDVTGSRGGAAVTGRGYVELTGYAE